MAERVFTLFHLNLVAKAQLEFDTFPGTREEWIRKAISSQFSFPHRAGGNIHWVPLDNVDECVLGVLQRTKKHGRHRPPHEGGEEIIEDEWQGAYVLIDPTHHEEGQRVAVENDVVGKPEALLKSLVAAMNAMPGCPYHTEIEPLFDAKQFWTFAEQHGLLMKYINFNFVVPNMWTPYTDLEQDLRETGAETGAQRVKVGFGSEDGVLSHSPRIMTGVEYAERGAGTLAAKAMDGAKFHSKSSVKTTIIPAVLGAVSFALFLEMKNRVLGRGQTSSLGRLDSGSSGPNGT